MSLVSRALSLFILNPIRAQFFVPSWGVKLAMALGFHTNPLAYVAWWAGTITQRQN
jgi:hypothetical protein